MKDTRRSFLSLFGLMSILPIVGLIFSIIFGFIPGIVIAAMAELFCLPMASFMTISGDAEDRSRVQQISASELDAQAEQSSEVTKSTTISSSKTSSNKQEREF